jgi:hypothetical protein
MYIPVGATLVFVPISEKLYCSDVVGAARIYAALVTVEPIDNCAVDTFPVNVGAEAHNAGDVTNTSLVSEPNDTGVADDPDRGVVRVRVGPVVLYVPSPTSQVPSV